MACTITKECRKWTDEEVTFLEDKWGVSSPKVIAKTLNRSIESIKLKACELKLGRVLDYGGHLTITQLVNILGMCSDGETRKRLIEAGIPTTTLKHYSMKYKIINMSKFWKWAENNQHLLNFRNFERGDLGAEPKWVDEKRLRDKQDKLIYSKRRKSWTQNEIDMLTFLVNQQRFTYLEIATKLNRTEGAVSRKLYDLGIKERPLAISKGFYTVVDDQKIVEMYNKRYKNDIISKELERSVESIKYRIRLLRQKGLIT